MFENEDLAQYIFDWNNADGMPLATPQSLKNREIQPEDETLRDGLQGTYLTRPIIDELKQYINTAYVIGIRQMNLGFPASSPDQFNEVKSMAEYVRDNHYSIRLTCAARALREDIKPIIDIKNQTGMPFRVGMFLRSSGLGTIVEGWSRLKMIDMIKSNIDYAKSNGLNVMFVAEDSTRARPETLVEFYKTAIEVGADQICIADTVGEMQFEGVSRIMKFVQDEVVGLSGVPIEWHGHNDLHQSLANGLLAHRFGAVSAHTTFGAIGERSGNIPVESYLVSLWKLGAKVDISGLAELRLSRPLIEEWFGFEYPENYPIMGEQVLNTATGPHARAIELAIEHPSLQQYADLLWLPFPGKLVDRDYPGADAYVGVGPQSGLSNPRIVLNYARKNGVTLEGNEPIDEVLDPTVLNEILAVAKSRGKVINNQEVLEIYQRIRQRDNYIKQIDEVRARKFTG